MIFKLILIVAWGRDHSTCNLQLDKTRNPQPATEKPATFNLQPEPLPKYYLPKMPFSEPLSDLFATDNFPFHKRFLSRKKPPSK